MTDAPWTRVEGMMIASQLDPAEVAQALREKDVLVQLEWFEATPQLLGLNVAVADGCVATVTEGSSEARPGLTLTELAQDLAQRFNAEVRLGSEHADALSQDESPLADFLPDEAEDTETPVRIVEIGRTPASSVPLLAALEGVDVADIELEDGYRALLAEIPEEKSGWNFGDLPLVSLTMTDGDLHLYLVTDDHLEHVLTYNWGMTVRIVVGSSSVEAVDPAVVDLVGDRPALREIAAHVPGADVDALLAAQELRGAEAITGVVRALALPRGIAEFLSGTIEASDVEGAVLHAARGISNAIGRSVDIMMTSTEDAQTAIQEAYMAVVSERPWIISTLASLEAAVGASMLVSTLKTPKPRSGWRIFAGVFGGAMLVDAFAEIALARVMRSKFHRR